MNKAVVVFIVLFIMVLIGVGIYFGIMGVDVPVTETKEEEKEPEVPKLTPLEQLDLDKRNLILKLNEKANEDLYLEYKEYFPSISSSINLKKLYTLEEVEEFKTKDKILYNELYNKGYVQNKFFYDAFNLFSDREDVSLDVFKGFNRECILDYACNTLRKDLTVSDPYLKVNLNNLNLVDMITFVKKSNSEDAWSDLQRRWTTMRAFIKDGLTGPVAKQNFEENWFLLYPLECEKEFDLTKDKSIQYYFLKDIPQSLFNDLLGCGYIYRLIFLRCLRYKQYADLTLLQVASDSVNIPYNAQYDRWTKNNKNYNFFDLNVFKCNL
jgi:hypothetical protein